MDQNWKHKMIAVCKECLPATYYGTSKEKCYVVYARYGFDEKNRVHDVIKI